MTNLTNNPSTATALKPRRTSSPAQARAVVQGLINLVLVILTVRDIRRRSDAEINGNRKRWMLAAFAPPLGPIAYLVFGRKHSPQTSEVQLEAAAQSSES